MSLAFNLSYLLGGDGKYSLASGDQLHNQDQCCGLRQQEEYYTSPMSNAINARR